jgi:uncharacterized BrkB/YihY/UPF0761 family membrane protein
MKLFSKNPEVVSPEDVPRDKLSPLSRKFIDWKTGMVAVIAVLLVFTFVNSFITNPTVSGMAVVDAETQDTGRLSNVTSILIVVFAFFGLFLFIITRRLSDLRRK